MSPPFNTYKFKQLQDKWEAKLAAEGLAPSRRQPNPYQSGTIGHDSITRAAKVQYYQMLSSHTSSHNFDKPLDEAVMQLYSQGMSLTNVAKELKKHRKSRTPSTIRKIVSRYEKLWSVVREVRRG